MTRLYHQHHHLFVCVWGGAIWMNGTDGMDGTDGTDGTEGKYEANGGMSRTNELDVLDR